MKETEVSRAIIEEYNKKLLEHLENEVVIVGAGPAGMAAGFYLAQEGVKTIIIEKRLATGGGIWAGAAGLNVVVFEDNRILDQIGVASKKRDGLYVADSVEFATALTCKAARAGAVIFNLMEVEDIIHKTDRVEGVVVNNTALMMASLPVDPFCISSQYLIDATGHPAEVVAMLKRKATDIQVQQIGEGFMDVDTAEVAVVEKTGRIYPGLYAAGMAVCAVHKLPRMGPIFGGMLKSGKKIAEQIIAER